MTVHAAALRFRVDPRDVPPAKAARRLHLTETQFLACLDRLRARGFPDPDPDTGNYDLKAVDAWLDTRSSLTMGATPGHGEARRIGKKIDELYAGRSK